ncbi:MAG: hypothetical protein HFH45_05345 [Bacilli bacterium]|nr:hypothetical protein [Bacilli bacterium]
MRNIKKTIIIILLLILLIITSLFLYINYRIKYAKINVKTIENLNIDVYSKVKLKDLIKSMNGKLIKNKTINTTKIGKQPIKFEYINDENIKVSYSFYINVVDRVAPIVSEIKSLTLTKGYDGKVENKIFCADNYDDNPKCEIIGDYNLNEIGSYNVTYKATDSSNNITSIPLTINIIEKENNSEPQEPTTTNFEDIKAKYKKENTKIGIDVSYHQGDIDYQKVKDAGAEFVFIRVGYGYDKKGKNVIDENFIKNIKGFNKVGIPVGIYFFSYAENGKEAKKQAEWVLKTIKKYKVDLPIVFDWENWSNYQDYHLSLYHLNDLANTFIKTVENKGYKGMLYSSKNYLKYAWNDNYNVWIAHYSDKANYEGMYNLWQICDDGQIDGINTSVDIDIMYE